jgi:hypothetical protein
MLFEVSTVGSILMPVESTSELISDFAKYPIIKVNISISELNAPIMYFAILSRLASRQKIYILTRFITNDVKSALHRREPIFSVCLNKFVNFSLNHFHSA